MTNWVWTLPLTYNIYQGLLKDFKLFGDYTSIFLVVDKFDHSASRINNDFIGMLDWAHNCKYLLPYSEWVFSGLVTDEEGQKGPTS